MPLVHTHQLYRPISQRKQGEQAVETEQLQHLLSARDVEVESHKIVICELKESISHKKGDISQLRQKLELADSQAEGALKALEKVRLNPEKKQGSDFGNCYLAMFPFVGGELVAN